VYARKYVDGNRLRVEVERSYEKWIGERTVPPAGAAGDQEPDEEDKWESVNKNGIPNPTCTNARRAQRALGIRCRYDVFHDKVLVESKGIKPRVDLDHTVLALRSKIHKAYKFDPGSVNTRDAILQLALENEFDPVADYLDALDWDGAPRLERWAVTYLGADDTELNREFGRLALIAAVRRVRHPGTKFDQIIVLEGEGGTEKSMVIVIVCGEGNFCDQPIFGKHDKEQQELLAGVWLYEIAELTGIRRAEMEHIKAFASRTHDRARPAYGRTRIDRPRRCILFATTNDQEYLKEDDRRFWPIRTTTINTEALRRDRDQLWAEAAQREREGVSIVLRRDLWEVARVEQQAREEHDPWDDKLADLIGDRENGEERTTSADILTDVLGIPISKQRDFDYKKLGRCMRRLGWTGPKKLRKGNRLAMGYTRPA